MTIGREVWSSAPALVVRTQGIDRSLEPGRSYSIGRSPESDIVVEEARVSWRHAVLRLDGSTWLLEDAGSTNQTFVGVQYGGCWGGAGAAAGAAAAGGGYAGANGAAAAVGGGAAGE